MWVARNKDNSLFCFTSKPIKTDYNEVGWDGWVPNYEEFATLQAGEAMMYCSYMRLNDSLFPELTWEDEPLEVSLKSNKKIDNELNDMFCQLCVDYNISDEVADEFIKTFKKNICG